MTSKKRGPPSDAGARIAELVRQFHEAERELHELTGGELDAISGLGKTPLLLHEAQERLRASEDAHRAQAQRQLAILNALPAHIALLDRDGVIVAVNEAWRRFASANALQSAEFLVGQNYLAVCESADGDCAEESESVARGIRRVLNGDEQEFSLEYPCHSPTERRWFRVMVTPLSADRLAGAVVMHVNVTERRLADEALRERERQQRQLAESLAAETRRLYESQAVASIGSWETDLRTLDVAWTAETFRIFEVSPDAFRPTHQGFLDRVHPADRELVSEAFIASAGQEGICTIEHRILLPDGRIKVVEERWQAFADESGAPSRAVGTCQDITERRRAGDLLLLRARQQEAVARIGFETARATTVEGILEFVVHTVAGALEVEMCKVLQLTPDGRQLRLVSGVGWQSGMVGTALVGVDDASQAGYTLASAGPIFVNDLRTETRFHAPPLLTQHEVISGLSVTISIVGKPWGVLGAHSRSVREFGEIDAQFMQSVASLLAVVIERLAAQRTLAQSERRMRDAQRIANIGSWELEIADGRRTWSDEVCQILGVPPVPLGQPQESYFELVHPDDRERVSAAQASAIAGDAVFDVEHRIVRPDGVTRHVRQRAELVRDEEQRPVVLSGTLLDITERVQRELQMEEAQRRYRDLVESSQDLIWAVDATGVITFMNQASRTIYGREPEEMIGRPFLEFVPPDQYEKDLATFTEALESGQETLNYVSRVYRKDGSIVILNANARIMRDAAGQVMGSTGISRDMTASLRAQEALRESDAHLQFTLESSQLGDWELDLATGEARHSLRHDRCFGYTAPLPKWNFEIFIAHVHPDDRERVQTAFQAAVATSTPWDFDCRVIWPDGTVHWIAARGSVFLVDGKAERMHGIVQDITQRKETEEQLRNSQRMMRIAGRAAKLGGWSIDLPEFKVTWSDETAIIHDCEPGYSPSLQEAIAFYLPEDRDTISEHVRVITTEGTPWGFEHELITAKQRRIWVRAIGEARRNEAGEIVRIDGALQDITERKKLEAQFLRAQRMESVGTLASGIAHDMNNILAPIMMSVELLKEDAKDEQTLETLNTLASSSQRGAELIRQLLAFARGIDGQRVPVDVHALLVDLHRVMKDVFPKNVEFSVSTAADCWKTHGDASQLHQVFLNLCVNARDAMPQGGKLTIDVENVVLDDVYAAMNPQGRAGAFVVVSVSDDGVGMPPAVIDRIFEPFFTTKEVGKGTGLGLSTVLGIVKSHGGFVNVYSEEGAGTQFKVYLPAQASETEREEVVVTQSNLPRGNGELVLLVDDELGVREIARKTLVRFGYRVVEAANGAEAVALYVQRAREVAIVLTDISMPVMDGVALITALRSLNPKLRVLVSSGLPLNVGVAKTMEWGAARFIPKPYTSERLLRVIHEELQAAPRPQD